MPPLTDDLRRASRKVHDLSDAVVNAKLIALFIDRAMYGRALALFYCVFRALEGELMEHAGHTGLPGALPGIAWQHQSHRL